MRKGYIQRLQAYFGGYILYLGILPAYPKKIAQNEDLWGCKRLIFNAVQTLLKVNKLLI
jgi:hypothetical protein